MKTLFESARVEEVKQRMAQLRPDSERQWGQMSPAQTLAHCSAAFEMALGKISPPRILIGRLFGPLAKKSLIINGNPMRRNSQTDKSVLVTDERRLRDGEGNASSNQSTASSPAALRHARSIRTSSSVRSHQPNGHP